MKLCNNLVSELRLEEQWQYQNYFSYFEINASLKSNFSLEAMFVKFSLFFFYFLLISDILFYIDFYMTSSFSVWYFLTSIVLIENFIWLTQQLEQVQIRFFLRPIEEPKVVWFSCLHRTINLIRQIVCD